MGKRAGELSRAASAGTGQQSAELKDAKDCVLTTTEANGTVVLSRDVAVSARGTSRGGSLEAPRCSAHSRSGPCQRVCPVLVTLLDVLRRNPDSWSSSTPELSSPEASSAAPAGQSRC